MKGGSHELGTKNQFLGNTLRVNATAFEWGCALFVVLDPFWYTMAKPFLGAVGSENTDDDMPEADRWRWTLGKDQYDWLKKTLEQSEAKYKFVMAHQVAGGGDSSNTGGAGGGQGGAPPSGGIPPNSEMPGGRGGTGGTDGGQGARGDAPPPAGQNGQGAPLPNGGIPRGGGGAGDGDYGRAGETATRDYEWGANPEDFAANRPGWSSTKSIHRLFVDTGVDVFFHGHDHVYAKEEADGVIYQECPHPANSGYGLGFNFHFNKR